MTSRARINHACSKKLLSQLVRGIILHGDDVRKYERILLRFSTNQYRGTRLPPPISPLAIPK